MNEETMNEGQKVLYKIIGGIGGFEMEMKDGTIHLYPKQETQEKEEGDE